MKESLSTMGTSFPTYTRAAMLVYPTISFSNMQWFYFLLWGNLVTQGWVISFISNLKLKNVLRKQVKLKCEVWGQGVYVLELQAVIITIHIQV